MVASCAVWYACTKLDDNITGSIYGTVTDYATGQPIGNVNVKLRPSGETTLTGNDGSYEFKDLEAGNYSLLMSKAEYADHDDDYIIEIAAGKSVKRDVQMRKQMASLRITDMSGNTLDTLAFGMDVYVTSKSFNVFNDGTVDISFHILNNCEWIDTAITAGSTIAPGHSLAVTIIIDRTKLSSGENITFLHIISNNGNNELIVTAIGAGSPTVSTGTANATSATSATCSGNVAYDGGSPVIDRGICWSTTGSPSLESGSHLSVGTGTGTFTGTMSGLSPNTIYYVRAYATNERGTAYGEDKQFTTMNGRPTVTINPVTNITSVSAVCGGSVSNNGGFAVSDKGLVWSTTQYPTLNDNHKSLGAGDAPFSGSMTGLSLSTTYYVRTYATNVNGTEYSSTQQSFTTTNGLPSVTTSAVTNETATTAVCGGSITSDGGYAITDKGLVWSTTQYPTLNDNHLSRGSGTGSFTGTMTGLSLGTTYYVRAYATNSIGTTYGAQQQFTTLSGLPTVTTATTTRNDMLVTSGGNVTSDGGYTVTARGICYSTTPYPDLTSAHSHTTDGSGTGPYSSTFTMSGQGVYYVRAYATNSIGTSYGQQETVYHPYNELPTFTYGGQTYRVAPPATTTMTWSAANNYCDTLTLYGYTDWRIPTSPEMLYIVSHYSTIGGFPYGTWWCSEVQYNSSGTYFGHSCVRFGSSYATASEDVEPYYVRPIRVEN